MVATILSAGAGMFVGFMAFILLLSVAAAINAAYQEFRYGWKTRDIVKLAWLIILVCLIFAGGIYGALL